mgnify:CR=1 FL=1
MWFKKMVSIKEAAAGGRMEGFMKKRLAGLFLSAVMATVWLTGCGDGAQGDKAQDSLSRKEPSQEEAASSGDELQQENDTELKGPGNVELSFLGFSLDFDPNTDVMAGVIEEKTGYKVNYSMLPSDGADEKLIADVAGGVKYDILKVTQGQFEKLFSQGALMPLNQLLDAYGKEITAGLKDKEMWAPFSDEQGQIYGIPFMNEYPKQIPFITVRKDLMREAGVDEIPATIDEFYDALVSLKNYYKDQYIILTAQGGWDETCKMIASGFGIYHDWMVDDDGNVYYMTEHENYNEYISFMKKLYDEGLLDSEFAVNTSSTVQEKLASGQAIMGSSSHSPQITISTSLVDNFGVAKEDIGYICPLSGSDGTSLYLAGDGVNYVTCILKNCENAADVIHYINLKVQNQESICIGEEGVHFNRDENGAYIPIMPRFTDDKGNAWWYINATDTESYAIQWQARVRKNEYQWDSFENTSVYTVENRPEIYVPNVFLYKPATGAYTEYNVTLKNELQNYMLQVISGNDKGLDVFTKDWQAAGGDAVKEDLQEWYTQYYHS